LVAAKTTLARRAASGWKRPFDEPIPLPRGRQLVTLEDAGKYMTNTKGGAQSPGVAGCNGSIDPGRDVGRPTMFARIGVVRALNRHVKRVSNPSCKIIIETNDVRFCCGVA
jgi:hypothetical protein